MFSKIKFTRLLNKNQSLKYQIMIILMEEHKKARLKKEHLGSYDGGNILLFESQSWTKMKEKICNNVSKGYNLKGKVLDNSKIFGLFTDPGPYCRLTLVRRNNDSQISSISPTSGTAPASGTAPTSEKTIIPTLEQLSEYNFFALSYIQFEITDDGYSYQYNGYRRSSDKLQKSANTFLLMTLFYYIFSWLFEPLKQDFITFIKTLVFSSNNLITIDFSLFPTFALLFFIFIIFYHKFFNY